MDSKLLELYDKEIILYGTGGMAQEIIPCLKLNRKLNILGVCDSHTIKDDEWFCYGFVLRRCNIYQWKTIAPNALILIVTQEIYHQEIIEICQNAGYNKIIPIWRKYLSENIFGVHMYKELVARYGDVTAMPDYKEKYKRLIDGLDSKSIHIIESILERQRKVIIAKGRCNLFELFSEEEKVDIQTLKEEFENKIEKKSEKLFSYKNYMLPINHFESSVFYYKHGISELNRLDYVRGKVIIDVGGYIGDSVLVLSELNPSKIYTFEGIKENFELLNKTIKLNNIENVVSENIALGSKSGFLKMKNEGSCSTVIDSEDENGDEFISVPVITLDEYVDRNPMKIGMIKVDIEGAEPAFLEGAKRTIRTQTPILLISIYHNAHDFFELKPLIESWNLGYRFKIHKPTFINFWSETLLIAEPT